MSSAPRWRTKLVATEAHQAGSQVKFPACYCATEGVLDLRAITKALPRRRLSE